MVTTGGARNAVQDSRHAGAAGEGRVALSRPPRVQHRPVRSDAEPGRLTDCLDPLPLVASGDAGVVAALAVLRARVDGSVSGLEPSRTKGIAAALA